MIETESKKAETYTDASVYEELYRRTEWVAGHSDMPDDTRRQHLHETLVLACREALKESRQGFGSLFAQVDYLCRKHNISAYDTMEIQRMRRNGKAEFRQHEQRTSNEVRTQFVPFGARTANAGKGEISCQRVKTKLAYVFTTSVADIRRSQRRKKKEESWYKQRA